MDGLMDVQANSNPDIDPVQKKRDSLLTSLGLHPAQIAAQNHLGGMASGMHAARDLNPQASPLVPPMTGVSHPPQEHIQTTGNPAPTSEPLVATPGDQPSDSTQTSSATPPKYSVPAPYRPAPAILQNASNDTQQAQQEHDRLVHTGSGISQIHNPFLRTLAHVGEGIETALVPGVAALTPGTEIHHDILMNNAQEHVNQGLKDTDAAVKTGTNAQQGAHAESGADYGVEQANELHDLDAAKNAANLGKAEKEHAAAEASLNPTAKNPFQAWQKANPDSSVEDWFHMLANNKGGDFDKAFQDAVKEGRFKDTYSDRLKAAHEFATAKQAPQRFPLMFVQTPSGDTQAIQPRPGTTIPAGAAPQTASGVNAVNTPTTQTRAQAETAGPVAQRGRDIKTQIDTLASSLGPAVGRWNQFMVNKGGVDYPEFAKLDTNLDLLASAITRTHFGARGGQEYRKELRKHLGEAQSPEDLKARIDGANEWLDVYSKGGKRTNPAGTPAPGGNQQKLTATQDQINKIAAKHNITPEAAAADFKKQGGIIQ